MIPATSVCVFPTPVGMVRSAGLGITLFYRFSHARGDGPALIRNPPTASPFFPRPWGWSVPEAPGRGRRAVFPTPVGMVRVWVTVLLSPLSFPHARGDGPLYAAAKAIDRKFSPRPWGWSALWHI